MGFFKSLKGDHPTAIGGNNDYPPPPGPPPGYYQGPAQSSSSEQFAPPKGPPPGREEYPPPPGPPPSSKSADEPPPYHDWTVIPDTALLPPPPSLGHDTSPSGNASSSDADRARDWCLQHPLMKPHQPTQEQYASVKNGDIRLLKPREYSGDLLIVKDGVWRGSTRPGTKDSCLLTSFPLYFAWVDSPSRNGMPKTVYFEIKIRSLGRGRGNDESSIALGYTGVPYPTWRMPGWQRGSLAVHGDDGRKYVNDSWGGKGFTSSFKEGETIGLGMTFPIPQSPPDSRDRDITLNTEVFLTRDGQKKGSWNLHEQLDAATDFGIDGLDGQYDLYGAIGIFGGVEFEALFDWKDWLWRPD